MSFMRSAWYCAGWSDTLTDTPIGIRLLGDQIVLYRNDAGAPVALAGRCPHRFAPLSKGKVTGDVIECPYHGLVFDQSGACTRNPHGEGMIPPGTVVRKYPIVERDGTLWIWMGRDADAADPSAIIATPMLRPEAGLDVVRGHLLVAANYQLVIDNLLDLTHAPYLHRKTLGTDPKKSNARRSFAFKQGDRWVRADYLVEGAPPAPNIQTLWHEPVGDFRAGMVWNAPANLTLDTSMTTCGGEPGTGLMMPSVHLLTPQDEHHTHYFFAAGRNVAIDDAAETERMATLFRQAFEDEDEPMIRDVQDMMGTTDLLSLHPVILQSDGAGIRARRMLKQLIREEEQRDAAAVGAAPAPVDQPA